MRRLVLAWAFALVCQFAATSVGQDWADKMFAQKTHDFGTVARGADAAFEFEIRNQYREQVHISGYRTSCGCVSLKLDKSTLDSRDVAKLTATFNTRAFIGQRNAVITVLFDRPYAAEVQLRVGGFIRTDVSMSPGVVRFESVPEGNQAQTVLNIARNGNEAWKITDVRSTNEHLSVDMRELQRSGGRVAYRLVVTLADDTPAGYLNSEINLITNDTDHQVIRVPLEANVVAALSASPKLLTFGDVEPGESVTRKVVLRAQDAFTIDDVLCNDSRFTASADPSAKKLQVVEIAFTADENTGAIDEEVEIKTEVGSVKVRASGQVVR